MKKKLNHSITFNRNLSPKWSSHSNFDSFQFCYVCCLILLERRAKTNLIKIMALILAEKFLSNYVISFNKFDSLYLSGFAHWQPLLSWSSCLFLLSWKQIEFNFRKLKFIRSKRMIIIFTIIIIIAVYQMKWNKICSKWECMSELKGWKRRILSFFSIFNNIGPSRIYWF